MGDVLDSYRAASKANVLAVLQTIIDVPPFGLERKRRTELISAMLDDLRTIPKGRIAHKDAALALLALKTVGKHPQGSEILVTRSSLSALLGLATSLVKDDPDASNEALRCIANALLLHESGRATMLEKEVNGGESCTTMLDKATTQDQIFILSRILFLLTVSAAQSTFIKSLVQDKRNGHTIVDIIAAKLDITMNGIHSGTKMAKEAMTDLLKLAFNLLNHYPKIVDCEPQNNSSTTPGGDGTKVIGDYWSPKLEGLLPPLLRAFHALPPTFPSPLTSPLTHVIHSLIAIPVNDTTRSKWFPSRPRKASPSATNSPISSSPPKSNQPSPPQRTSSSSSSRSESPTRASSATSPTIKSAKTLDRTLSLLSRSLSRSPSPNPQTIVNDTFLHVHDLLEITFAHYFPDATDPDDVSIRDIYKNELKAQQAGGGGVLTDLTLDDTLSPLIVLMTRFCQADETCRVRAREWLVPPDLDRSTPLEGRSDTLGRCLRLLGSVYHERIKNSVGQMLFAICDEDASTLSSLFGYGNVAGFLFNQGIMSAPPPPDASSSSSGPQLTTADGAQINPITGTTMPDRAPEPPDLTEEEKEQEMEKLFVLFDRLERSGALPPNQNPIRKGLERAAMGGASGSGY